jgi:hypothetical protein
MHYVIVVEYAPGTLKMRLDWPCSPLDSPDAGTTGVYRAASMRPLRKVLPA